MSTAPARASARYLLIGGLSMLGTLAAVWVYVALFPMAFMESGYASWAAKKTLLQQCRLGEIVFFGDSRLDSAVMPTELPSPGVNLGLAAGTPIEARAAVERTLRCPTLPKQVVFALIPEHFGPVTKFFWQLSVRYGFVGPRELWTLEDEAARLGDHRTLGTATPDGLYGRLRDQMYAWRFPAMSFASLVRSRVFGRAADNEARYRTVLADRGWTQYDAGGGAQAAAAEAPANGQGFVATPLQQYAFEQAITALTARGVQVLLFAMPIAASNAEQVAMIDPYRAFLEGVAARHPGVTLVSDHIPVWPERLFVDGNHYSPEGARLLSGRLAACMPSGRLRPDCRLEWQQAEAQIAAPDGSSVLKMQQQRHRQ